MTVPTTPFKYTRDLLNEDDFSSSWVDDLSYDDVHQALLVKTTDCKHYLYMVPHQMFDALEQVARDGESIGSAVGQIMNDYGPSIEFNDKAFWYDKNADYIRTVTTSDPVGTEPAFEYPKALRTEVQFTLDGDVKFMKSEKTVEEAVKAYLVSVEALGLDATLEAVHVYFV